MFYLRPGNLYKDFVIEPHIGVNTKCQAVHDGEKTLQVYTRSRARS